VLDYDQEAARYDATRGGDARADAAAAAIEGLLQAHLTDSTATIVDVGCGTGIVTVRLARPGRSVIGVDSSTGMAAVAAGRLPGRITLGDVTRLPLATGSADAVTMVWLLHLLSWAASAAALAEAARVLRPGGLLITTVNKNDATYPNQDDAARMAQVVRAETKDIQSDDGDRVAGIVTEHGLVPAARATFAGLGQGLSPRKWRERLRSGPVPWTLAADPDRMNTLYADLAGLPDQDRARPDPVYQVLALRKQRETGVRRSDRQAPSPGI
jgi:ubiquinone/menaquinone biosynthesis C-methylase UbiE